jgi:hypothetical protein
MTKLYVEHPGKVIETGGMFTHVMAITLDPTSNNKRGVARCITSREGHVQIKGYVDRSKLYVIEGDSLEQFKLTKPLIIEGEDEIIGKLTPTGWDFIGLEDPDIWIDDSTGLVHLYFTIPIKPLDKKTGKIKIHLGHAVGNTLDTLQMTEPVLLDNVTLSAKEVSIAPLNSQGFRYNLIESRDRTGGTTYSTVHVAMAHDMGKDWKYGNIAFHPHTHNIPWIAGHASPGPLLPRTFIDLGPGKLLGIMNGREANTRIGTETKYGVFSVGLFIYDFEKGVIEWISPDPLIIDSQALTITFASHFVETKPGEGIVYAHVDDSFVRAYTLTSTNISKLLP